MSFRISVQCHNMILSSINILRRNSTIHGLFSLTNLRRPGTASLSKDVTPIDPLPKGFHPLFTQIEYECASPLYQHFGSGRRTCLKTGKWSGQHVSCSPGEGSTELNRSLRSLQHRWRASHCVMAAVAITELFMISKACLHQDRWCSSQTSINLVQSTVSLGVEEGEKT